MPRPEHTRRLRARSSAVASFFFVIIASLSTLAHAGDFVDTRLNFTLTNENVLVKPGQTDPSVPGWRFGQPSSLGLLFFDNYDTRYTGYENLTHLVIFKKVETAHVVMEAAYVLRLLQFTDVNLSSIDDGSYLRIQYYPDRTRVKKFNVAFTAFPLNSDRMRLGYSWRISWGGSPMFFKYNPDLPVGASAFVTNTAPAPGAKLEFSDERWYAYAGAKSSTLLNRNPSVNEQVAIWALLLGAGVDIIPSHFRLEANGGYFDRGTNPLFFGTQVVGAGPTQQTVFHDYPVDTLGATVQLSIFDGISPTTSIDMALYRNDPFTAQRYFARPTYMPGFNWMISSEWTLTATSLQDANRTNSTTYQKAYAGDINFRAQVGKIRLKADFETRSLEYILQNQPSLVPFQSFIKGSTVHPEIFGSLGLDYLFEKIGLTAGGTIGVLSPANYTPPANTQISGAIQGNTGGTLSTGATIVVRDEGDISILPEPVNGKQFATKPIFGTKVEVREDFLEWFAAIVQAYYEYDANQTILTKSTLDGTSVRQFNFPHQLGFNITLQARY